MGWQWHQLDHMQIICTTSLQTDNNASTSSLNFLQAGCSSQCQTNAVKALKASAVVLILQKKYTALNGMLTFSSSSSNISWASRSTILLHVAVAISLVMPYTTKHDDKIRKILHCYCYMPFVVTLHRKSQKNEQCKITGKTQWNEWL